MVSFCRAKVVLKFLIKIFIFCYFFWILRSLPSQPRLIRESIHGLFSTCVTSLLNIDISDPFGTYPSFWNEGRVQFVLFPNHDLVVPGSSASKVVISPFIWDATLTM